MFWLRIDNRLVHGQVVETWLPYLQSRYVVIVNDAVSTDVLRQQIIKLALPSRITPHFTAVANVGNVLASLNNDRKDVFCLVENCQDAQRIVEQGIHIQTVNVGNIHYSSSCYQLSNSIAATSEDISCFQFFEERGIALDFRCVPSDKGEVKKVW